MPALVRVLPQSDGLPVPLVFRVAREGGDRRDPWTYVKLQDVDGDLTGDPAIKGVPVGGPRSLAPARGHSRPGARVSRTSALLSADSARASRLPEAGD